MVDVTDFKNAMSMLSAAVNVVTTDGPAGRHGFTASAVCSVTDTPPTLLVCMNTASRSYEYFVQNKVLAVNVLADHHAPLSAVFASKLEAQARFEHGTWHTLMTQSPILDNALVSFDCQSSKSKKSAHTGFLFVVSKPYNKANTRQAWCILTVNTMPSIKLKSKRPANHNAKHRVRFSTIQAI